MLFQYQKFEKAEPAAHDSFEPPLSPVRFALKFNEWNSGGQEPSYVHVLPNGATVTGWQLEGCHIELLLCRLGSQLENGRKVEGCGAAMFRVRAHEDVGSLAFSAALTAVPKDVEIGPESGEGLDAQSWTADGKLIMLGTEDGDFLARRAQERDWMPFRLQRQLAERFPQYLENGITVNLPGLGSAELCQVQFVIAWAESEQSDNAAWFAVDRQPAEILAAAGCS